MDFDRFSTDTATTKCDRSMRISVQNQRASRRNLRFAKVQPDLCQHESAACERITCLRNLIGRYKIIGFKSQGGGTKLSVSNPNGRVIQNYMVQISAGGIKLYDSNPQRFDTVVEN